MDDLFIINDGGQLLYSWHLKDQDEANDDDLISGFLTAMNTFASIERGEDIKSLKLKETNIIFEKYSDYIQKITFVATTKNDDLIELLHSVIHDIMDSFTEKFGEALNREFDGEVTKFHKFDEIIKLIIISHGLDTLSDSVNQIDKGGNFKSIVFLEPKGGYIFYIHAKQFVNKEKVSFLIPLIVNSSQFLYKNNLNEELNWILLTTVRNENVLVEIRKKIIIVKQYQLPDNIENDFLALDFFKSKNKYIKKPKKIIEKFEKLIWDNRIKQVFLVDLVGKIIYSKIFDEKFDCSTAVVRSYMKSEELINSICPWGILTATIVNALTGKDIEISPSEFNKIGAKSRLKIVDSKT